LKLGKASMDLILDTHVLLWMLLDDPRLGSKQIELLEDPANVLHVSAVTAFEIATKVRIGKLPEAREIAVNFEQVCRDFDYVQLAISNLHGLRAGQLHGAHRDPFDRLLAAQSIVERMPLMTSDPTLKGFGVETLW
jgi:PIN domain nuclease of toxin-antitoxin system